MRKRSFENTELISTRRGGEVEVYRVHRGKETFIVEAHGTTSPDMRIVRERGGKLIDPFTDLHMAIEDHMLSYFLEWRGN